MGYELARSARLGSGDAPATVAEWSAAVRARGNTPTVFPDGAYKGQLAERYLDSQGHFRYALPPANIRALDAADRSSDRAAIVAGEAANVATGILSPIASVGQGLLAAPRAAISQALGIPPMFVTLGAIAAGVFLFREKFGRRRGA